MPLPLKALLRLAGAATFGGGIGLTAGSIGKKKELNEVGEMFSQYNQEENKKLTDEAFMNGVQFALSGGEGVEKQAFCKDCVETAFKDEMSKIALPTKKPLPKKPTVKAEKTFFKAPTRERSIAPFHALEKSIRANKGKVAVGTAGVALGGVVGAAIAKKMMNKEAAINEAFKDEMGKIAAKIPGATVESMMNSAKKFVMKNKKPLAVGAGAGAVGILAGQAAFGNDKN